MSEHDPIDVESRETDVGIRSAYLRDYRGLVGWPRDD